VETYKDLEVLPFASQREWETWLRRNHTKTDGVWIKFAKKKSGIPTVTYEEALDVALCYGWIDGQAKGLDDRFHLQRWTPRRSRSVWSKRNTERALALIGAGKMKPAGLREVERAKNDGRWDAAYDAPSKATVPDDLAKALKRNAKALKFFVTLDGQNRYAILHRLQTAKKPETRARRIDKFVEMLGRGEKLYP
jgi:uncharacterized protein YdeI (YjbR/CyaY-like superfamily)